MSHTRIQFLKGRLHDLTFGRAPEGGTVGRWEGGGRARGGWRRRVVVAESVAAREEEEDYYGGRRHDPDEELDDEGYFDGVADDDTVSAILSGEW